MLHNEVVQKWNDFCVESGLRKYCKEVCKGYCCQGVKCGENCIESIPCVSYLCRPIRRILNEELREKYYKYSNNVEGQAISVIRLIEGGLKEYVKRWGTPCTSKGFDQVDIWEDPTKLIKLLKKEFEEKEILSKLTQGEKV